MNDLQRRARSAQSVLALATLGLNPHQRRGPDGRWIKMPASELKRPRRSRKPSRAARGQGARPPASAPYGQRRDALAKSVQSGIDDHSPLGAGEMGELRRLHLADGTQAIYKKAKGGLPRWTGREWTAQDQTDAEELAALVAAAVGAKAPAVQRVGDTELHMEVAPGVVAAVAARDWGGNYPTALMQSDDAAKIGLLDMLLDIPDRHEGNWLVDGENIYAVDHGLAFMEPAGEYSNAAASPFAAERFIDLDGTYLEDNPLSVFDISHLHRKLDELEPEFRRLGRLQWLDDVRTRLNQLADSATSMRGIYPR